MKKYWIIRTLLHVAFWSISILVFGYIFKISHNIGKIDIIYSTLFHLSIILGVYFNRFAIIPYFLQKNKYTLYMLSLLICAIAVTVLNQLSFSLLSDYLLPSYYLVSQFNFMETGVLVLIFLGVTTLILLSESWFKLQETKRKIIKIEKENINNQLKALKAQINPHFLFNSLTVLYSLALKNAKETPATILMLSDILRYVIYDSGQETVRIKSEVKLLNHYLMLQKHRIDESSDITFQADIIDDVQISPMIFLPLVENSFKHGVKGDVSDTFVHINMFASKETVRFEISNNKGTKDFQVARSENSGIGIANTRKRLKLLYPNKHQFAVIENMCNFKVNLSIEL